MTRECLLLGALAIMREEVRDNGRPVSQFYTIPDWDDITSELHTRRGTDAIDSLARDFDIDLTAAQELYDLWCEANFARVKEAA